jgi:hypothetical protein
MHVMLMPPVSTKMVHMNANATLVMKEMVSHVWKLMNVLCSCPARTAVYAQI